MAVDPEVAAIIGGCVAGAVIFIAIVAVVIYLLCGKRRRKKERDQKKFHQLSPHTSPTHSQPSTLGHGPPGGTDPRLPKVSSNGLWVGAPGIYASTPSPAYYYGRPGGPGKPHHLMQPAVMQRASSETRIPTSHHRGQGYRNYHVPARRSASLQRVPSGPAVYATGGSQQRIYHSQQLLTPVYEVMDPSNGSIYDVYQIGGGGGSKTKLLQEGGKGSDRHHHHHHQHQKGGGKKLERSQSDVIADPVRRSHRPKPSSAQDQYRQKQPAAPKNGSVTKERAQVHEARPKSSGGMENPAFMGEKIIAEEGKVQVAVVASATDSMKLLAKNKTDDQKYTVVSSSGSSTPQPSKTKRSPSPEPSSDKSSSLHYSYGGDIYAVPEKDDAMKRSRADNPILARMQDMVIERANGVPPAQVIDPVTDIAETAEPLLITPREGDIMMGPSLIQNPIYQDVEEVRRESEAVVVVRTSGEYNARELSAAATDERNDGAKRVVSDAAEDSSDVIVVDDVAAASAFTHLKEAGASGDSGDSYHHHNHEEETAMKPKLESRWSTDTDGASGKHISVTAKAFEFLDTYLSDEDGGDLHSPPQSPVLSERDMMY
ncbi:uncharacterized protein [Littorina saxatilis]|uniref:uncharacterized protein isoform X2 n=1 Tax=Littorina saxatilis TaxID=31220 RepID=UPI0038B532A7